MIKNSVLFLLILISNLGLSQQKTLTLEDATLGYYKGLYPERHRNLIWLDEGNQYAFVENNQMYIVDGASGKEIKKLGLVDLQQQYMDLNYFPYVTNASAESIVFQGKDAFERYNYNTKTKTSYSIPEGAENIDFNPKTDAFAFTVDNNLYYKSKEGKTFAVTDFKDKNIVSGQAIARSEYGISKGTFWSPNAKLLAFYQKDETNVSTYPLVDITTYPASEKSIKYPMAGQGSEVPKIGIYNTDTHKTTYLAIDTKDNRYLTNLTWAPNNQQLLVAEINRATTQYDLNLYDATTGKKIRTILTEKNDKWVEPQNEAYFIPSQPSNFLWLSQKDGYMNLYEYNLDGKFIRQLTHFNWVVKGITGFSKNSVIIEGTGEDPRENHYYKVNLKTGKTTPLTTAAGTHQAQLSKNGNYLIDFYSSLTVPGVSQIINVETGNKKLIKESKNPLADYKIGTQELVELKAADNQTLYGVLMKPADFDPSKKYPVLVYVYGGPHAQLVTNSYLAGASMWLPAFATLNNYIVFTLDNRGSSNRGFDFESVIHRQLGEKEIEDQLLGVDYLKSLPYVDSKRIAVNGWSFGGFMTTSLMLRHPGIFTTAVAGGPVIDWKYYEVMYGERYMDTPQENPQGYEKAKVSNYIKQLDGNLMLITGSVDNVVVPQHSMSLLKAAVENNVQVDFFSYPMHEHNVMGRDRVNLIEKMADYIVKHNK